MDRDKMDEKGQLEYDIGILMEQAEKHEQLLCRAANYIEDFLAESPTDSTGVRVARRNLIRLRDEILKLEL